MNSLEKVEPIKDIETSAQIKKEEESFAFKEYFNGKIAEQKMHDYKPLF